MNIAFFECFSGVSGDMIIGSLVDAGLDLDYISSELKKLELPDFHLFPKKTNRCGICGTKLEITFKANQSYQHHHRNFDDICNIIKKSALKEQIQERCVAVFERLAHAEAKVHNADIKDVHFHEVGAVDSIIDIVGAVIGFDKLGFDKIFFSPIATGSGYVDCEHGRLPVPAPATAELLKGYVLSATNIESELTTPTGAAILTTLGEQLKCAPDFKLTNVGYGAGTRDNPELPNLLRILIGEAKSVVIESEDSADKDVMWLVETNIDDMSGEVFGYVLDKLFDAGAADAYMTPVQMKKSRPAVLISALVPENRVSNIESVLFEQSTTFGIRKHKVLRNKLIRETVMIETLYGNISVKIGRFEGVIKSVTPEFEDCRKIADEKGVALKLVYNAAIKSAFDREEKN